MPTTGKLTTRIRFLGSTRDERGRVVHQAGDTITGELLRRHHDFLLVRAGSGHCMYLDTTRTDLYCIEMCNEASA
jgi:hypothetical protein